ncbi:MAG: GFA family protein [Steroidobacteraceae bacterium]
MRIDGRCLCGSVTYEAEIDPAKVLICHCSDCQNHSGSAWRVVVGARADSFRLLSGELRHFEKIADSGRLRSRSFCPVCGTNIYACTPGDDRQFFGLRVGTVNQRKALRPSSQLWLRSALPWSCNISDLPGVERQLDLTR